MSQSLHSQLADTITEMELSGSTPYLRRKVRLLKQRINNPTPRQRLVGAKKGFLTKEDQEAVNFLKITNKLQKSLEEEIADG
jgi:hypothetical protein